MSQSDLSFPLLSLLSKERAVYGLRNGDHERYRRHCANKIHRLRQVTGQTCGKGKTYKSPPKLDTDSVKDVRDLQLLLFSAERALAHSHSIKSELTRIKSKNTNTTTSTSKSKTSPNSSPSALKKDQLSWLRKSLKISTSLFDLINALSSIPDKVDGDNDKNEQSKMIINQKTKSEMTIYQLTIRSELFFEKGDFGSCLSDLAVRRKILSLLNQGSKNSYDEALSNEYIDSHDSLIRYCAYKLGRNDSHDISGVMKDLESGNGNGDDKDGDEDVLEAALPGLKDVLENLKNELGNEEIEKDKKKLNDISFSNEKIEFRNAELVKIMTKVQDVLYRFENKKGKGMRGWDRVLSVLGEAEGIARKLKDDHEASGSSTSLRSNEITKSLNLAHDYIIHLLLSHRIKRDLSLIDNLSATLSTCLPTNVGDLKIKGGKVKTEEIVKGLGGIIKLLDTVLQSLRGISELTIVQEKEGVRIGVQGLENYYHALRCYYLARLHCLHPNSSYPSSVALLEKAKTSIDNSVHDLTNPIIPLEEEIISISKETIETLKEDIEILDVASKKGLFSQNIEKPVFFDMAFNYIDIPFDELEVLSGKKEKSTLTSNSTSTSTQTGAQVIESANTVKDKAVEGIKKLTRETRETTPFVERHSNDDDEDTSSANQAQGQKKGWLGGWFGKK
ncbi:uncharacterized protein IL334_000440 [Kwoniella shivajii]|uniref:Signal recognition particle subunit SRP68 n=1 Tax=Kwoniella shivajii TaxID=564305 RepID=A0ABZ1CP60_9TREE|nr:hypothetical protein IL334_000440 [Kwoniella shivajii]